MISLGPVFMAIETKCFERAHISRTWIKEVDEPFRTGHGWRVRLGHFALQFGTCTKNPGVGNDIELFRQHMFMRWMPYLEANQDDAPGQGSDEGLGDDQVWVEEPEPVLDHGVVGGSDVPDLLSEHVARRGEAGRGSPGGQGAGAEESSAEINERWRQSYNDEARRTRSAPAQDGQGA